MEVYNPSLEVGEQYLKGSEKFPLDENRYGYLPSPIQRMLKTNNDDCIVSSHVKKLKLNHDCILRKGVENHSKQSFIGCISDLLIDVNPGIKLNIKQMKNLLIKVCDIDKFITLQNGSLVDIFKTDTDPKMKLTNIRKYEDSQIYKETDLTLDDEKKALSRIINSYENYIKYLKDDEIIIDYKYLWDLVTEPNDSLFKKGINLIIIEFNPNDNDSVELVCPSNYYSKNKLNMNKKTGILIKYNNYYEPIYVIKNTSTDYYITRLFSTKYKDIVINIKLFLEEIKKIYNDKCETLMSIPLYNFKRNLSLKEIVKILKLKQYVIMEQIFNLSGRVVYIKVSKGDKIGLVPCFPSSPIINLTETTKWITDDIGFDYINTIEFLNDIYNVSKRMISCKPIIKVVEKNKIVGIITESNEYVPINPIVDNNDDYNLIEKKENNNILIDKNIYSSEVDNIRVEYVKKLRFENKFFSIFRNTIRILLNEYNNNNIKENIISITKSKSLYYNKLEKIIKILKKLTKGLINFVEYSDEYLLKLIENDIVNCYSVKLCKSKTCSLTEGNCVLNIPKFNLINKKNNEETYYGFIADEILRYNYIKKYILNSKVYLTLDKMNYNLKNNEMLILDKLLTNKYFDKLEKTIDNKYIKYNSYYLTQPIKSQIYSNEIENFDINNTLNIIDIETCETTKKDTITGIEWNKLFNENKGELIFNNKEYICTFYLILILIRQNNNEYRYLTYSMLKEILSIEYENYIKNYNLKDKILNIINSEGKVNLVKSVLSGQLTFKEMIMNNNYYCSNIDLFVLSNKFNIPIIIYSVSKLKENNKQLYVANSDYSDKYYIIKVPAYKKNYIPIFKLIYNIETNETKIDISDLDIRMKRIIDETNKDNILLRYLQNFKLKKLILKK